VMVPVLWLLVAIDKTSRPFTATNGERTNASSRARGNPKQREELRSLICTVIPPTETFRNRHRAVGNFYDSCALKPARLNSFASLLRAVMRMSGLFTVNRASPTQTRISRWTAAEVENIEFIALNLEALPIRCGVRFRDGELRSSPLKR
jgi:hypothetical protein